MANQSEQRKARFRAALALERKTQVIWAKEHGITQGHLSQVLSDSRESKRLCGAIDDYSDKVLSRGKVRAA
jgi:hypothetical protein